MTKPNTTALLAAIARWRRIEAAAREVDASHVFNVQPYSVEFYRERLAMKKLHKVLTEATPCTT